MVEGGVDILKVQVMDDEECNKYIPCDRLFIKLLKRVLIFVLIRRASSSHMSVYAV